jgi:hypothetical protein
MKWLLNLLTVSFLAILLSSCGGGGASNGSATPNSLSVKRFNASSNPLAIGGEIDLEAITTGNAYQINFDLLTPQGVVVKTVLPVYSSSSGSYFPNDVTLRKILLPNDIVAGNYILRGKASFFLTNGTEEKIADISIYLQPFNLHHVGLSKGGIIMNGSNIIQNIGYQALEDGVLYQKSILGVDQPCPAYTSIAEWTKDTGAKSTTITNYGASSSGTQSSAAFSTDTHTLCLQFVSKSGFFYPTFSYVLSYIIRPINNSLVIDTNSPSNNSKTTISLISMPTNLNTSFNHFDWYKKIYLFTRGDVAQQTSSNSARFSLNNSSSNWNYIVKTPIITDDKHYLIKIDSKPPRSIYIAD